MPFWVLGRRPLLNLKMGRRLPSGMKAVRTDFRMLEVEGTLLRRCWSRRVFFEGERGEDTCFGAGEVPLLDAGGGEEALFNGGAGGVSFFGVGEETFLGAPAVFFLDSEEAPSCSSGEVVIFLPFE